MEQIRGRERQTQTFEVIKKKCFQAVKISQARAGKI